MYDNRGKGAINGAVCGCRRVLGSERVKLPWPRKERQPSRGHSSKELFRSRIQRYTLLAGTDEVSARDYLQFSLLQQLRRH